MAGSKKKAAQQEKLTLTDLSSIGFVNLSKISKHLECSVCSNFFYKPYRFRCGHTFCKQCIEEVKKQSNQPLSCPQCRQQVDLQHISEDLVAKNLIEEQLVFCLNKSMFCGWKGPLSDLEVHMHTCDFKESDEASKQLIDHFDKNIKSRTLNSELNTTTILSTVIDEKLQENINKNVGDSLLMRLMNKNKDMAKEIVRQIQTKDGSDSKGNLFGLKKSNTAVSGFEEKSNTVTTTQSTMTTEYEEKLEDILFDSEDEDDMMDKASSLRAVRSAGGRDDNELDEVDELLNMLSDTEGDELRSTKSAGNDAPKKKGGRKPRNPKGKDKEPAEKKAPATRNSKKRVHEDPLPQPDFHFAPQIQTLKD